MGEIPCPIAHRVIGPSELLEKSSKDRCLHAITCPSVLGKDASTAR